MKQKLKKIIADVEDWSGHTITATTPEEIKVQIRQIGFSLASEAENTAVDFCNQIDNI